MENRVFELKPDIILYGKVIVQYFGQFLLKWTTRDQRYGYYFGVSDILMTNICLIISLSDLSILFRLCCHLDSGINDFQFIALCYITIVNL